MTTSCCFQAPWILRWDTGPPSSRLLFQFFLFLFFFFSDRPTQNQKTHSTINEKKRGWPRGKLSMRPLLPTKRLFAFCSEESVFWKLSRSVTASGKVNSNNGCVVLSLRQGFVIGSARDLPSYIDAHLGSKNICVGGCTKSQSVH